MDVVVVGGGLSGVAAAVSAAKEGADTALIERAGFLGGLATGGWVGPILGLTIPSTGQPVIKGFLKDLVDQLHQKGGCYSFEECLKRHCVEFNAETLKIVLDEMVTRQRIKLYLDTVCIGARVEDETIKAVEFYTRKGRLLLEGKVFIDATGDGELIFLSGADYRLGREEDGRVMATGSFFRIINVPPVPEEERKKITRAIEEERQKGNISVYHGSIWGRGSFYDTDGYCPNMTRYGGSPVDPEELTAGEIFLRKQAWKVLEICQKVSPFFQEARIMFAPQIGVRESRRLVGMTELTEKDILAATKHQDSIARSTYWIDIHCPLGRTRDNVHLCRKGCPTKEPCVMLNKYPERLEEKLAPPEGDYYTIPLGCLVSANLSNLLAAGRCVSANPKALAAIRVMAPCMAMGQAAGVTATLASLSGKSIRQIPYQVIQQHLQMQGGLL